ncbi:MAG: hypothetical protein [Olavius algarvensis Delta 4 endosymbiont]|nr:MAG: hypothetical protein [Olavius algarvensis Delta 4 endosymbiont]
MHSDHLFTILRHAPVFQYTRANRYNQGIAWVAGGILARHDF